MVAGDHGDDGSDFELWRRAIQLQHLEEVFSDLQCFAPFIGYERSGGTLVAALLDAHPQMVFTQERDVFERDEEDLRGRALGIPGLDKRDGVRRYASLRYPEQFDLLTRMLMQSAISAEEGRSHYRLNPDGTSYRQSYEVPGADQGRYTRVRVVGTKNAVETADVVGSYGVAPLVRLQDNLGVPIRLLHVVRNPFDNIATMSRQHGDRAIVRYFKRSRGVAVAKAAAWPLIDVHLEDLIGQPEAELARICRFLGVEPLATYLQSCASVVMASPSTTRDSRPWTSSEVRSVRTEVEHFPWLARYADTEVPT